MSTVSNNTSNQTVIPWDVQTKTKIKENTAAFLDSIKPHTATLLKTTSTVVLPVAITQGSAIIKEKFSVAYPAAAPLVGMTIDLSTPLLVGVTTRTTEPCIDSCVEKTYGIAQKSLDQSTDYVFDFSARFFSVTRETT